MLKILKEDDFLKEEIEDKTITPIYLIPSDDLLGENYQATDFLPESFKPQVEQILSHLEPFIPYYTVVNSGGEATKICLIKIIAKKNYKTNLNLDDVQVKAADLKGFGLIARKLKSPHAFCNLYIEDKETLVWPKVHDLYDNNENHKLFNIQNSEWEEICLNMMLGSYSFDEYKSKNKTSNSGYIVTSNFVENGKAEIIASAFNQARDLINTPAEDLEPEKLREVIHDLSQKHGGEFRTIRGLSLEKEAPLVHMVGRASNREPLLIETHFGHKNNFHIAIAGKGVCFDTGGLGIKPSSFMRNMKKDMGGSAHAIAFVRILLELKLPLYISLYVAAVDNSIAGNAFRPGDVMHSRKGITVENAHTDAEGRLILADALTMADELEPDLIISFATLTGAARVALGADVVPFYSNDNTISQSLLEYADKYSDPLWQLPFYQPYMDMISSKVADISNTALDGKAGSIIAALFLKEFISPNRAYLHFDLYAWTDKPSYIYTDEAKIQGLNALLSTILLILEKSENNDANLT